MNHLHPNRSQYHPGFHNLNHPILTNALRIASPPSHHYYNHEEHPGRFQCTVCGKNFKAKQGLQVQAPLIILQIKSVLFIIISSFGSFIWILIPTSCGMNAHTVISASEDSRPAESTNYVIEKPTNQTNLTVLYAGNCSKRDKHLK